jgi:hypothetical protein
MTLAAPVRAVRVSAHVFDSVSLWRPGHAPRYLRADTELPTVGLRWFDLSREASPEDAFVLLEPLCDGLELEMLEDLCIADELPEGRSWNSGTVRLASSFAVYAPGQESTTSTCMTPSAEAVYEPVELLANEDWLITRWHGTNHYCGARLVESGPPRDHSDVTVAVAKRWSENGARTAGDLGILIMHELALTYAPAHRRIYAAVEEWELNLYGSNGSEPKLDGRELHDLWGARARLRDWINPLNVPGLRQDLEKAWLPASDHKEVEALDDRVDHALSALARVGEALRSSFHMLQLQHGDEERRRAEVERDGREAKQQRLERFGTLFLVPTLIVGFYGANTWVPGEGRHWGFWAMVAVLFVITAGAYVALDRSQRARRSANQH